MIAQSPSPTNQGGPPRSILGWILVLAMMSYSLYATVDTALTVRRIPGAEAEQELILAVKAKYAKAMYMVSHLRMVRKLTKNCENQKEKNIAYSESEEIRLYRQFQGLHRQKKMEQARALMERISELAD